MYPIAFRHCCAAVLALFSSAVASAQDQDLRKIALLDRDCAFYDAQAGAAPLKGLWTGPCANGFANGNGIALVIDEQKRSVVAQYHGGIKNGYFNGRAYYARPLVDSGTYEFADGLPNGSATIYRFAKSGPTSVWQGRYSAGKPQVSEEKITPDTDKPEFEKLFKDSRNAQITRSDSDKKCTNGRIEADAADMLRRAKIPTAYVMISDSRKVAECLVNIDSYKDAYTYYLRAAERGDEKAQGIVAVWHEEGRHGVEKSEEKAEFWYRKAIANGNDDAEYNFADFTITRNKKYPRTEAMNANIHEALLLMSKSALKGNKNAMEGIVGGCRKFSGDSEKKYNQLWLSDAIKLSEQESPAGKMYAFGSVGTCYASLENNIAAADAFKKAIKSGESIKNLNLDARYTLAEFYYEAGDSAYVEKMRTLHREGHKVAGSYVAATYFYHPVLADAKKARQFVADVAVNPCESYKMLIAVLRDEKMRSRLDVSGLDAGSAYAKGKIACGSKASFDADIKSTSGLIDAIGLNVRLTAMSKALSGQR